MQKTSAGVINARKRCFQRVLTTTIAAAAITGSEGKSSAQTSADWIAAPANVFDYTNANHWNPNTAPALALDTIATINNNGIAQIVSANAEASVLLLGLESGQQGHVVVRSGGVLNVGTMRIGGAQTITPPGGAPTPNSGGIGTFVQEGGTVNVTATAPSAIQSLFIGDAGLAANNTANGTYTIESGTLTVGTGGDDAILIGTGAATQGAFVQDNGTVNSSGFVSVGRRGSIGSYTMSGGTLNVGTVITPAPQSLWIGDGDEGGIATTSGTFTQTAGDVNVTDHVEVGRRSGNGTYTISGGTLSADLLTAGGGPATENSAFRMRGSGTFNVRGNALVTLDSDLNIGLTSGTVFGGDTEGLVDIEGGSINLTSASAVVAVGNGFGGRGTLDISGGSLTMVKAAGATSILDIGRHTGSITNAAASASGTLRVSGTGALDVRLINLNFGGGGAANAGAGTMRQIVVEGGSLTADTITFAGNSSRSARSLTITAGVVDIGFLLTGNPNLAGGGSAVTHISGGDVDIDSLELFSNSTFRVSAADIELESLTNNPTTPGYRFATATLDVQSSASLTINGPGNFGTATGNTLTKTGTGALNINAVQNYAPNSIITVSAGALNLNTIAANSLDSADAANLTINVSGTASFGSNQRLKTLNVGAGAIATVTAGADKTLKLDTLIINTSGGTLDLADNDLIIDYAPGGLSPEFQLRDLVKATAEGATSGIVFTIGDGDTALAIAEGTESGLTDLNGITFDDTTVIGKYTYYGDANLDGQVTSDDYVAVDVGIGVGDSWVEGDFDFSGSVTSDDYVAIDVNLGKGSGDPLAFAELKAQMIALHTAMFGDAYVQRLAIAQADGFAALVPEPTVVSAIGIVCAAMSGGRRRRAASRY